MGAQVVHNNLFSNIQWHSNPIYTSIPNQLDNSFCNLQTQLILNNHDQYIYQ